MPAVLISSIRRSMKTETRSAADSPFIPSAFGRMSHLIGNLLPYFTFSLSLPLAPTFLPTAAGRISSIVFSKWMWQADIMEATLTREFVHATSPLTYLFKFTSSDAQTSDSKFKLSPKANTRLPSAMLTNSVQNSVNLRFQTSMRRWKTANESQSSPFSESPVYSSVHCSH